MAHQRWARGEVPQADRPTSLHLPRSFQHGTCGNGIDTACHRYLLFLPAPVQIAVKVGDIGSVTGCGHWDVGSRNLKQGARGSEGRSVLQGAQGRRCYGFAARTLEKIDCHDQSASAVWNGIWRESDGR